MDLANRNEWPSEAKNLDNSDKIISISPDMTPVLKCLKKDILEQREELSPDVKSRSQVKYLPRWPFCPVHHTRPIIQKPTNHKGNHHKQS